MITVVTTVVVTVVVTVVITLRHFYTLRHSLCETFLQLRKLGGLMENNKSEPPANSHAVCCGLVSARPPRENPRESQPQCHAFDE